MTKLSLGNFKLTFGPDSVIVQHIQAQDDNQSSWNLQDDKLVLEFDLDPNAPHLPPNANYISSLMRARSPSTAESVLKGLSYSLRAYDEFDVPRHLKLTLADALDRVVEDGGSVKFLYGKQDRVGRPNKAILHEFLVFETVEQVHSKKSPLGESTSYEDAYEITATLLNKAGITDKLEDEMKRVRRRVTVRASSDLEYFFQLIHYLREKGYRISQ